MKAWILWVVIVSGCVSYSEGGTTAWEPASGGGSAASGGSSFASGGSSSVSKCEAEEANCSYQCGQLVELTRARTLTGLIEEWRAGHEIQPVSTCEQLESELFRVGAVGPAFPLAETCDLVLCRASAR